ncbi:MAG: ZIP family metal transporter, partial [Firmicutes bacterium]|nr:ZIP family metal transporter [Bacillota bacterium]
MSPLLAITLIGTVAGVLGTGFGGLITNMLGKPSSKVLSFVLAFSGGVMLAVIFNDLIPESLDYGNITTMLIGILTGIVFLVIIDYFIPHQHVSSEQDPGSRKSAFVRSSILLGIGIAMHNFPEGLAIGASYIASENLGLRLAIVIAFHNIPEGMAMGGPMKAASFSTLNVIKATTLAGLPMGIGAFIGGLLGSV